MRTLVIFIVFASSVAQFPFSFSPELSPSVKEVRGIGAFVSVWEFSLHQDKSSHRATTKMTLAPKTLIVPDDLAMVHLIPQDASHPLYLQDKTSSDLRREFVLSHLVLEKISPTDTLVSTPEGITATTFSGRSVLIRKDKLGELTVEGVNVLDVVSLPEGIQVYRLRQPLFNLRQKVKNAFDLIHGIGAHDPIGPPLIIPEMFSIDQHLGARSPAPPPREEVKPPAVPPEIAIRFSGPFTKEDILPPAIPPHFALNKRERKIIKRLQPPA